jgi:hypothetical protein
MALFGSVGKFFTSGVGAAILPVVPLSVAAGKAISGDVKGAQQTIGSTPFARAAVALKSIGSTQRRIDNPQTSPGSQQMRDQYNPEQYFQPAQFAGGSYDPNLGGGFPADNYGGFQSWDSLTSSTPPAMNSWGGYSAPMTEDWAADW